MIEAEQRTLGFALGLSVTGEAHVAKVLTALALTLVGFLSTPLAVAGAAGSIALLIAETANAEEKIARLMSAMPEQSLELETE